MSPSKWHDLMSGKKRGTLPWLQRTGLSCLSAGYAMGVRIRNRRYDRQSATRAAVPVISVGNLTTGGTGKTPMVEWLARWFRQRGARVSIISRGYGAEAGSVNDEAMELEQKLPDVPHLQNPDRIAAAEVAVDELDTQLILLDDAFQHRRIHRDLDIVLLDALEPFGFGHLLPRGLLREPLSGLDRADVIVLSRADQVPVDRRGEIQRRTREFAPKALWVETAHRPVALLQEGAAPANLETWHGRRVAAFCGIGNPRAFRQTLLDCNLSVVGFREFPDHHAYQRDDIASLEEWANDQNADAVLCTQKDFVKLRVARIGRLPLLALSIGLELLSGSDEFERLLEQLDPAGKTE